MSRSRACAIWRASRCRAKSACNGGARRSSGEREGEAAAHPVAAALRETLERYGFVATPLLELIDAHSFDLYDEPMATRGRSGSSTPSERNRRCSRWPPEFLAQAKCQAELFTLDAASPCTIAGILRGFATACCAPAALRAAGCAGPASGQREDIFAERASAPLLAALGRNARARPAASRGGASEAEIGGAGNPAGIFAGRAGRPAAAPHGTRQAIEPFALDQISPWRRQWLLWRAARDPRPDFRRLIIQPPPPAFRRRASARDRPARVR